jgi:hypothetical protein
MNEYLNMAVKLLRSVYQEDITAISQILVAEADNNIDMILSYLDCVEEFVIKLKEKIKEK